MWAPSFPADSELAGRRVLVCGLGLFGGGEAVVRFLVSRGADVTVTDLRPPEALAESLDALAEVPFRRVLGRHEHHDFEAAELLVVNPAVPPTSLYLGSARAAGVPWTSEVGLALSRLRARLVFVTGSKGKSTTAAVLHAMVAEAGIPATLAGNMGAPLVESAATLAPDHVVVFEVSSFQLEQLVGLPRRPELTLITNLFPVHLDRHGTFEAYCAVKRTALDGARVAVLNERDRAVAAFADGFTGEIEWFDPESPLLPVSELRLRGAHNAGNVTAAWTAARRLGVELGAAAGAARRFEGLPHRLRTVHEASGVTWVDDSIATTPRSACAALDSFTEPVILLAGGVENGIDVGSLAARVVARARALVSYGASGPRVAEAVRAAGHVPVHEVSDLAAAVRTAREVARSGDVVLLSPAFPSFDGFRNFAERGDRFRQLAMDPSQGAPNASAAAEGPENGREHR